MAPRNPLYTDTTIVLPMLYAAQAERHAAGRRRPSLPVFVFTSDAVGVRYEEGADEHESAMETLAVMTGTKASVLSMHGLTTTGVHQKLESLSEMLVRSAVSYRVVRQHSA